MKNKLILLSLLITGYSLQLGAQEVYENHRSEVYNYIGLDHLVGAAGC